MSRLLFDTTTLEKEHDDLLQEIQVIADMIQKCIYKNAHVAQDQESYQKKYDSLTERYETKKKRLQEVTDKISQLQSQKGNAKDFLKAFEKTPDALTEFSLDAFTALVDYITVYAKDDIRVTFRNGQEIKA